MEIEILDPELLHDVEAERLVCGFVICDNLAFSEAASVVSIDDFFIGRFRRLWQRITEFVSFDVAPLDYTTIRTYLKDCEDEALIEAVAEAHDAAFKASSAATHYYASRIREASLHRQLMQLRNQIGSDVSTKRTPADVLLKIQSVTEELTGKLPQAIYDTVNAIKDRVLKTIKERANNGGELQGISTGLKSLDNLCAGLRPGQLILIGARPGMGKTQMALNLLWAGQLRSEHPEIFPTVFFTLEMSKEEIVERLLAQLGDMSFHLLKTGKVYKSTNDMKALDAAVARLESLNLTLFDETDNVNTVPKLEARIRALPQKPKLIVIDYISYLKDARKEFQNNKVLEVQEIAMNLKRLAVRLQVPVVVLAQLNRELERRQDKRPVLSDFRDSGGIEQAADLALFIYREAMYTKDIDQKELTELIIGKQRNGQTGTAFVHFNQETGIFSDPGQLYYEPPGYTKGGAPFNSFSASVRKNNKRGSTAAAHNQGDD